MTFNIASDIINAHHGARFFKTDLHIHTPASLDWNEHNTPEHSAEKIQSHDIVEAAINAGLDIIAITDHNSVEWCQKVIDAAKGTKLIVLPGFELTARPGIHVLAIFSPEKEISDLRKLLYSLKIKNFGNASTTTDESIENKSTDFQIVRLIQEEGGLTIPAHVDLDSGLIGRLKGGVAANDFVENSGCNIFEISKTIPQLLLGKIKNNSKPPFAIITGSDAHRLSDIGKKAIWIKMDYPNIDGIKQIGFEPNTRISFTEPGEAGKAKIIGMFSDGGLLANQYFAFNDDLNCIIGGRGSGKSAILDYLRFVFGNQPVDEDLQKKYVKRIVDLICDSTTVYVLVKDNNNEYWLFEKRMSFTSEKRGSSISYSITSEKANIYQVLLDKQQIVKFEKDSLLFRIEIYGQGEVQSITNTAESDRQLQLIDNFALQNIAQRKEKIAVLNNDLQSIESLLEQLEANSEKLTQSINGLANLKKRVEEIRSDFEGFDITGHQLWEDINTFINNSLDHMHKQINSFSSLNLESLSRKPFSLEDKKISTVLDNLLNKIFFTIDKLQEIEQRKNEFLDIDKQIEPLLSSWKSLYETEALRYKKSLQEAGVESLSVLNTELANKEAEIEEIEVRKIPQRTNICNQIEINKKLRNEKLYQLINLWQEIRDCRINAAEIMTDRLNGKVHINIASDKNLNPYFELLTKIIPEGIYGVENQLQKVIDSFPDKMNLAETLRKKDFENLMKSGITKNTATVLIGISEKNIRLLERTYLPDIPRITLIVDGKEKELTDLSDGEKCTVILSIILLDASCPLIIDQPEDELDHAFIMSDVVDTLLKVKQKSNLLDGRFSPNSGRQFIIATHNQNIPVLGDAEMVLKMKKVSGSPKCIFENAHGLENQGTINFILGLEGGPEAFLRRWKKYNIK